MHAGRNESDLGLKPPTRLRLRRKEQRNYNLALPNSRLDIAFLHSWYVRNLSQLTGKDTGPILENRKAGVMDNEPTTIEGLKTGAERNPQESEPAEHLSKKNTSNDEPYQPIIIHRPSSAENGAAARSEQNAYVPPNQNIYSPLNRSEHEIRILVLEAGESYMPLKCHLLQLPLAKAEEIGFETVSYCWGHPDDQDRLEVEGLPLRVPMTAIQALQRFRYPNKDRLLWIDSICLNQIDLEERGHEVARMRHIYSRGQKNLIWLGLDDANAAAASYALHAILDDIKNHHDITEALNDCLKTNSEQSNFADHFSLCNELAAPLLKLFARPWFRRLWVAQEAFLAQRNLVFCGNVQMELVNMLKIYPWLTRNRKYLNTELNGLLTQARGAMLFALFRWKEPEFGWPNRPASPGAALLLWNFQESDATDPRDHVYGILGLLQNPKNGETPPLLQPNYSENALTVFRNATRYAVYQDASLDVLSSITHRIAEASCSQREPLSWVPRWSRKWDFRLDPLRLIKYGFDASLGAKIDQDLCGLISSDILELRGLFIEELNRAVVTRQSEICDDLTNFLHEVSRFLGLDLMSEVFRDAAGVLCRVLVAGVDGNDRFVDDNIAHTFERFLRYFQERNEPPPTPRRLPAEANEELLAISDYRSAVDTACDRRRLFTTAGGRMGLGPQTMQPGDVAVVLYGGRVPFILRHHKGTDDYEFIGECYIDGIMFGEAVEKHREEGREDVVFSIR